MTMDPSPEAMALIRHLIETRGFRDPQAVVEEALRRLAGDDAAPEDEDLAALVAEAEASGPPVRVDLDALRSRLKAGLPWRG